MAFGFPPKIEATQELNGLSSEKYLATALESVKQLGWTILNSNGTGFTALTRFSWSSWSELFSVSISEGQVLLMSKCNGSQIVDWGKNSRNIDDFTDMFNQLFSAGYVNAIKETQPGETEEFTTEPQDEQEISETPRQKIGSFWSLFVPRKQYFVTPIIINLNILVFVLMVISRVSFFAPSTSDLIKWGANLRSLTLDGDWWRLISNTFLHIGIFHLLLNMYALIYIGILLENYLGRLRFFVAYLCTGIIASLASIYIHPMTVSAGASGAIFGMYGVFLAMLTTNIIDKKARMPLLTSIAFFVIINLINGVKAGIDNAAHIGGLVSGAVIGYAYYPSLRRNNNTNINIVVSLILAATLTGSYLIYTNIPHDAMSEYRVKMILFTEKERQALAVFNGQQRPDAQMLKDIKINGIDNWKAGLIVLKETESLQLPAELKLRNDLARQYCLLELKKYELLYNALKFHTLDYDKSVDSCNNAISIILNSVKSTREK